MSHPDRQKGQYCDEQRSWYVETRAESTETPVRQAMLPPDGVRLVTPWYDDKPKEALRVRSIASHSKEALVIPRSTDTWMRSGRRRARHWPQGSPDHRLPEGCRPR